MALTAIFFLISFATLIVLAIAKDAYWAGIASIYYYYVAPKFQWWANDVPDLRYSLIAFIAMVLGIIIHRKNYDFNLFKVPQVKWLLGLLFLLLIAKLWAVNPPRHHHWLTNELKIYAFVFLFVLVCDTQKKLNWALSLWAALAFFVSYRAWEIGRIFGPRLEVIKLADKTDANGVAVAIVVTLPLLLLYLFWGSNRWLKFGALIALAFNVNALVLFNSRGSFLGMIVGLSFFVLRVLMERQNAALLMKVSAAAILSCAVMFHMADESFWERMGTLEEIDLEVNEGEGRRIGYWTTTFDILRDYPLGVGATGYEKLSAQYMPPEWLTRGSRSVHSTWFEILGVLGYQGLIVYASLLGSCLLCLRRARKVLRHRLDDFHLFQSYALEACLVCQLVPITFINTFFVELTYWTPMFIMAFYRANVVLPAAGFQPQEVFAPKALTMKGSLT